MPKQPVTLSANICGCGDPLSMHTKVIKGTSVTAACEAKDCACTGFISEAEAFGDAPHSISTDTMIRAAGLNPKDPRVLRPVMSSSLSVLNDKPSGSDEDGGDDGMTNDERDARQGPKRTIVKVVSETGGRQTIELDCGHTMTIKPGWKSPRCRKCKSGRVERTPVASEKPKRTPVAAEPEKPKRTPVVESSEPEKKPAKKTPVTQVTPARRRPAAKKNNAKKKR